MFSHRLVLSVSPWSLVPFFFFLCSLRCQCLLDRSQVSFNASVKTHINCPSMYFPCYTSTDTHQRRSRLFVEGSQPDLMHEFISTYLCKCLSLACFPSLLVASIVLHSVFHTKSPTYNYHLPPPCRWFLHHVPDRAAYKHLLCVFDLRWEYLHPH